ncbi:MAG: thioredoxin domain-containing protein [Candidatus Magasanikbacteria bacterium]|nr:thioredoxin domain-containing protein [Candidatus Magasanikbacteria bacterium]
MDSPAIDPPKKKHGFGPSTARAGKICLTILASLFGLAALIFTALFVYYLWQFRFGDAGRLKNFSQEFEKPRFTLADANAQKREKSEQNPASFIRPHNPKIGNPEAEINIIAFIDFQCPFSQESYRVFNQVIDTYGSAAQITFKHLPLTAIHPQAMDAALASSCAGEQKAFWEYYRLVFENKNLDETALLAYAETLRLDMARFKQCLQTKRYQSNIEQDMLDAVELGVRGTPTYFVNQDIIEGVAPASVWAETILKNLKR